MGATHRHSLKLRSLDGPAAAELTRAELVAEDVVDAAEACRRLGGISLRQLRKYKAAGLLPFTQDAPGCRVAYSVVGIRKFNESRLHC